MHSGNRVVTALILPARKADHHRQRGSPGGMPVGIQEGTPPPIFSRFAVPSTIDRGISPSAADPIPTTDPEPRCPMSQTNCPSKFRSFLRALLRALSAMCV
jgi:hypothetical protein